MTDAFMKKSTIDFKLSVPIDDLIRKSIEEVTDVSNTASNLIRSKVAGLLQEYLDGPDFKALITYYTSLASASSNVNLIDMPNVKSKFTMSLSIERATSTDE